MQDLPPRSDWQRCFLAVEPAQLNAAVHEIEASCTITPRQVPQAGLAMLQLREPNRGERFLLGELPLAEAAVTVTTADGVSANGGARVMRDDQSLATHLAILDATLAGALPLASSVGALVRAGADLLAEQDRVRSGLLHATTVDFSLLEAEDDDD